MQFESDNVMECEYYVPAQEKIVRKMTKTDIINLIRDFGWGTLCMTGPDGNPYAIEFSYFLEGEDICGLVHPRGMTARCLAVNPNICFKVCDSDRQCKSYRAVSCFGNAAFEELTDQADINNAWDALVKQLGLPPAAYDKYKARYQDGKKPLPLLRIHVDKTTGITNRPKKDQ